MKKIFSSHYKAIISALILTFMFAVPMVAVHALVDPMKSVTDSGLQASIGGGGNAETALPQAIGKVVNVALGLLGIIFIVLIIWAGFKWLFAQGDEAKIKKARDMILQSVIAVIIIFLAYAITNFVLGTIIRGSSGILGS